MANEAEVLDCPRVKTWMTPCIARDGATALSDRDDIRPLTCIGCSADPRHLLLNLSERYEPARRYRQTHDPVACANRLTELVRTYVETLS